MGTSTPDGTLDVMRTISGLTTGLRFSSWHFPGITAGGIIDSYDDNGTVRSLVLQNNGGNVGIGTTSPAAKLDVQGTIVTRGDAIEVGGSKPVGSPANQYAYLDLRGDDTYSDYGLRLLRGNTGANAWSEITHRGTGDFIMSAVEAASLKFRTQNADRMVIRQDGNVKIFGKLEPSYDSGWRAVNSFSDHTETFDFTPFTGNPIDTPSHVQLLQCGALSGNRCTTEVVYASPNGMWNGSWSINPISMTIGPDAFNNSSRTIHVRINGPSWVWGFWDSNVSDWRCTGDADGDCRTGYYRILVWK